MKNLLLFLFITASGLTYGDAPYHFELIADSNLTVTNIYTFSFCSVQKGTSMYTNYMPKSTSPNSPAGTDKMWVRDLYLPYSYCSANSSYIDYGIIDTINVKIVTQGSSYPSYPHYPSDWVSYPSN